MLTRNNQREIKYRSFQTLKRVLMAKGHMLRGGGVIGCFRQTGLIWNVWYQKAIKTPPYCRLQMNYLIRLREKYHTVLGNLTHVVKICS